MATQTVRQGLLLFLMSVRVFIGGVTPSRAEIRYAKPRKKSLSDDAEYKSTLPLTLMGFVLTITLTKGVHFIYSFKVELNF